MSKAVAKPVSNPAAVAAALDLFWRKGYADTSMAEIVEATGLNRYAIYSNFGSKRDVFLAALDAYFEEGRKRFEPIIRDHDAPPMDRVRRCFDETIAKMEEQGSGCFMCHVAVQNASEDPKIAEAVQRYFDTILMMVEIMMQEAEEAGTLNPALSPAVAAELYFDSMLSMGVHAKAGATRERLDAVTNAAMAALSAPAPAPEQA